jgi:hypothetical protein
MAINFRRVRGLTGEESSGEARAVLGQTARLPWRIAIPLMVALSLMLWLVVWRLVGFLFN